MLKTVCLIKSVKDYFPTMRGRATAVRRPAESPHQCASYSPSLDCTPLPDAVKFTYIRQEWNAPSVVQFAMRLSIIAARPPTARMRSARRRPIRPRPEIYNSRRENPKQVKYNWNSSGKRPNMAGEKEDMGSLLMDIADGDRFNIFSEEWAMEMEMGLENEAENVGRDGRQDGFLTKTAPNLLDTEPPESTDPIETMMGAYGIAPSSPQGYPPSRHYGYPPSRHGYPPSRHGWGGG